MARSFSPDKRVRDLLQGIKDPKANAAKETILANNHLWNDFSTAVTHLATSLQLQGSISDNGTRNVNGTQSGRGCGQGCGKGSRGGRGGKGHGRGKGGRNIYLGCYSPEQWQALSKEDEQWVRDGRAASAASQASTTVTGGNAKRNIAGLTVEEDTVSAITTTTAPVAQSAVVASAQATDTSTASQSMSRRQRINAIVSSARNSNANRAISRVSLHSSSKTVFANCELDSHADHWWLEKTLL